MIKVRKKGSLFRWFSWRSSGKAHFAIEVPRNTDVDVDTAGGSILVRQVRAAVRADTSGGGITIEQVQGPVDADTSGGAIRTREIDGSVTADTSGGGITVKVDPEVALDIDASTSGGSIINEIELLTERVSRTFLRGKLGGGGEQLRVRTSGGSIRILPL